MPKLLSAFRGTSGMPSRSPRVLRNGLQKRCVTATVNKN